jgi:hypothetical protein
MRFQRVFLDDGRLRTPSPEHYITDEQGFFFKEIEDLCLPLVRANLFAVDAGDEKPNTPHFVTIARGIALFGFSTDPVRGDPGGGFYSFMWIQPNNAIINAHYVFGPTYATPRPHTVHHRFFVPDHLKLSTPRYNNSIRSLRD